MGINSKLITGYTGEQLSKLIKKTVKKLRYGVTYMSNSCLSQT